MIGTVYKIEIGENIYIGSTIKKLNERQRLHNIRLNQNVRTNKLYEECRKHNVEKIICIALETKEIEDDLEIRELENKYIDELKPSLNHKASYTGLTGLTQEEYSKEYSKEYREKNKETVLEKKKIYYENNKDRIIEQRKQYRKNNKDKIRQQRKEYRENNIEKISEQKKVDITCPICGFVGRKHKLNRHKRTKKCLAASVREI
jgi:hypothetical protein